MGDLGGESDSNLDFSDILLDEITTVLHAQSMTWKGQHPIVKFVTQTYQTGVKLTQPAMSEVEKQVQRLTDLGVQNQHLNLGK